MKLENIKQILDLKLDKNLADAWDNCGLLIGRMDKEVERILLALELTPGVLTEAKEKKCDMILTHHPVIFSGLKAIVDNQGSNLVYQAIQSDVAVYSAHTNFDKIVGGLNDYVASLLGAKETRVLDSGEEAIVRIFNIEEREPEDFLKLVKKVLKIESLRLIGPAKEKIKRVGLVTGAGSSYAKLAFENGADIFITGDVKYHEAMDFKQQGQTVMDAGHFETEKIFPEAMAAFIRTNIKELNLELLESKVEESPFHYYCGTNFQDDAYEEANAESLSTQEVKEYKEIQKKIFEEVEIFTDGGSRGNPGDAAIGYVIKSMGESIYQYAEEIGIQTNNVAEYQAVLSALKKARTYDITEVTLYMDSQLVERQLNGVYKVKNEDLRVLYNQIMEELKFFKKYKIIHVKREQNKLADKLVNMALDKQQIIEIEEI